MKSVLIVIISCMCFNAAMSQELINPYQADVGAQYPGPPIYENSLGEIIQNCMNPTPLIFYNGEYMISLSYHHWRDVIPAGHWQNLNITYEIETAGFPFTINCWDVTGCANDAPSNYGTLTDRILMMPDDAYNATTTAWGGLSNIRNNGIIHPSGNFISGSDNPNHPEA